MLTPGQIRRNAICHTLDSIFFMIALTLFSLETVIPAFIKELSDSNLLIGLASGLFWVGLVLPPLISAKRYEGLAYKKPTVLFFGVFMRVGWLVLFLWLFFMWQTPATLIVLFLILFVGGVATGMTNPLWSDWYLKTTAEGTRGRLMGFRLAIPGMLGIPLGVLIHWLLSSLGSPQRYQALLIMAFLASMISFLSVALVHEEETDGLPNQRHVRWADYIKGLAHLAIRPGAFRRFLTGGLLVFMSGTVTLAFLTKYGLSSPAAHEGIAGAFTGFYQTSMAVGALAGGFLSDRRHVIAPFRLSPVLLFGALGIAIVSPDPAAVCAAFGLLGASFGMTFVAYLPAIFKIAHSNRIPSYAAVTVMCLNIPRAIFPPLMGLLMDAGLLNYRALFAICGAVAFVGWLLFLRMQPPGEYEERHG
ncbi:MAG: MFS transporter [Planctomycetes bacterium]|nr:MFS transporter [Planctomycetota bacterium]